MLPGTQGPSGLGPCAADRKHARRGASCRPEVRPCRGTALTRSRQSVAVRDRRSRPACSGARRAHRLSDAARAQGRGTGRWRWRRGPARAGGSAPIRPDVRVGHTASRSRRQRRRRTAAGRWPQRASPQRRQRAAPPAPDRHHEPVRRTLLYVPVCLHERAARMALHMSVGWVPTQWEGCLRPRRGARLLGTWAPSSLP